MEVHWQGVSISMLDKPHFDSERATNIQAKENLKNNKYRTCTADEIITYTNQNHSNASEKKQLKNLE